MACVSITNADTITVV